MINGVERLAESGQGDVKRLHGVQPPAWRLRIGNYRVIFSYDYDERELRIRRVAARGGAYRE